MTQNPTPGQVAYARRLGMINPENYTFGEVSNFIAYGIKRRDLRRLAAKVGCDHLITDQQTLREAQTIFDDYVVSWLEEHGVLEVGTTIPYYESGMRRVEAVWPDSRRITLRSVEGGKAHAFEFHEVLRGMRASVA